MPPQPSPPPPPPLPPLPPPPPAVQQADEANWLPLLPMQMPQFPEAWDYPDLSGTSSPSPQPANLVSFQQRAPTGIEQTNLVSSVQIAPTTFEQTNREEQMLPNVPFLMQFSARAWANSDGCDCFLRCRGAVETTRG